MVFAIATYCFAALVIYLIYKSRNVNAASFMSFPFVGVIPFVFSKNGLRVYRDWSNEAGPVFTTKLGFKSWVIVNNYECLKAFALKHGKYTSHRHQIKMYVDSMTDQGYMFKEDNKKVKSATMAASRKHIHKLKEIINIESKHLIRELLEQKDEPIAVKEIIMKATTNVISQHMLASRSSYNNSLLTRQVQLLLNVLNHPTDLNLITAMTIWYPLRHLPVYKNAHKNFFQDINEILGICLKEVKDRKNLFYSKSLTPECVIDSLFTQNEEPSPLIHLSDFEIMRILVDFIAAGTDTTATAIQWSLLYLAQNPNIQQTLYEDIVKCDGTSTSEEILKSPLLSSLIDEVIRHRAVVPLAFHKCSETFKFGDKTILQGQTILFNFWAAAHDPNYFKDPDTFKFDRFIDDQTGEYCKSKYLIPFGIGPRMCPGNKIAETEAHTFLSEIIKTFKVAEHLNHPLPSFEDFLLGIVTSPIPFKLTFTER